MAPNDSGLLFLIMPTNLLALRHHLLSPSVIDKQEGGFYVR